METGSTVTPAGGPGDTGVLIVEDEQFESILDVPFVTVNMIDGKLVAEIVKSADPALTLERIQAALNVGYARGQHSWARVEGDYEDYDVVTIHFMPDGDL